MINIQSRIDNLRKKESPIVEAKKNLFFTILSAGVAFAVELLFCETLLTFAWANCNVSTLSRS